ncbi:2-phosphoxylose phosphatase 1-like [Haliotis rufescens]|uniref:2-phosphoxylose phosphatase 1-like n=1 Tax=Haliotis rufescens TaxID=6454 RepID=UPI00201F5280|nr:2-phosphoxylose phosphatase 1-like [Haliotis rufescens]
MGWRQVYRIAPQGYDLISVHVITRHGDRSPMYTFNRHPNPRLSCQFDPQEVMKDAKLAAYVTTMRGWEGRQREDSGFMSWALYPGRKVCDSSQLSAVGAKQLLNIGYLMHERYVQKWRLFGPNFRADQVLPRSTEYSRTYQSAIAFLYAFLPRFNLTEMHVKRVSNLFFCSEQTLAAPCTCPVLRSLKKQADAQASSAVRNSTGYDTLINAMANIYDMPVSRLPRLWAMMDVFLSHTCNSLPLPCNKQGKCITQRMVTELWGHVTNYTKYLITDENYRKYASLALHPFLTEISEQMQDAANGVINTKFHLLSGHDATLVPLTVVFGAGGGTWPRYAARIVLELYSRKDTSEHYIRVLHDGKDVTREVIFCHGHTHDGMCPLKQFVDFVLRYNLRHFDETDYINLCYSPS